jgi:YD repeat-containing protein
MRTRTRTLAAPLLALLLAAPAAAQDTTRTTPPRPQAQIPPDARQQMAALGEPDVFLDVPNLRVEEITLEVQNLQARLSLDARLANLLSLSAGADVSIDRVNLRIRGVQAQARLIVRLDNVAAIIERTLATIDQNPEILVRLLQSVDNTVNTVGGVANQALAPGGVVDRTVGVVGQTLDNVTRPGGLLTQTINTLGQTVQVTLDQTGNILERTLDTTGNLVNSRTLGAVTSLPVVRETAGTAGQVVRTVRHASGALIEYTLDRAAGRVLGARVVQQATGTPPR